MLLTKFVFRHLAVGQSHVLRQGSWSWQPTAAPLREGFGVDADGPVVGPRAYHDRGWRACNQFGLCGLIITWVRPGGTTFTARPDHLISWGSGIGGSVSKRKQVPGGLFHFPPGAGEKVLGAGKGPDG